MAERVFPIIANWAGLEDDPSGHCLGTTPPARLEYLAALNDRILAAATTPYAITCLVCEFDVDQVAAGGATGERWLAAHRLPVGAKAMRGRWMQAADGVSGTPDAVSALSDSSGGTGNDVIEVTSPYQRGTLDFPIQSQAKVFESADNWVPSPTEAQNRLFELTEALAPSTEKFELEFAHAFSGTLRLSDDLLGI